MEDGYPRCEHAPVEGGNDKGPDGYRKDTMPMIEAHRERGWKADAVFYSDVDFDALLDRIPTEYDAYVSRINPGHMPGGEARYFELLDQLTQRGMVAMPHPDAMVAYGAKDALVKLSDTEMVTNDTYAYYDTDSFRKEFPSVLSTGTRVLKQNRGSTGSGIWRVEVIDQGSVVAGQSVPVDTMVRCTEALDNHVEEQTLGEFMAFCDQYLVGDGGMVVDMPFLPLIGGYATPLIWTGDFMLDTNPDGSDAYVLGEINCSCVGFTSHLESGIQGTVADEIINVVTASEG